MWPILVLHSVIKLGRGTLGFATSCAPRQVQPPILNKPIKRRRKKEEKEEVGRIWEGEGGREGDIFIQCVHIGKKFREPPQIHSKVRLQLKWSLQG